MVGTPDPLQILRAAFGDVKRVSRTANGYKMSAPHREDKNPSFSVFVGRDGTWMVTDFAEGWTMPLGKYVKEYAGYTIERESAEWAPRKRDEVPKEAERKRPDPELVRLIQEHGDRYIGHGFAKYDSRELGIFRIAEEFEYQGKRFKVGTVAILVKGPDGRVEAIKLRHAFGTPKYTYAESGYGTPLAFYGNHEAPSVIIVEGELKAAMTWLGVLEKGWQDKVFVIGVPGSSNFHKAWPYAVKKRTLVILDPDIYWSWRKPDDKRSWPAQLLIQELIHRSGATVLVSSWHFVGQNTEDSFGSTKKDINDYVAAGMEPGRAVHLAIKSARRPHLSRPFLYEHMPVFKNLASGEQMVVAAHYLIAISGGRWVNGNSIEHTATNIDVMSIAKMPLGTITKSRKSLKQKGILSKDVSVSPVFRLNMGALRRHIVTDVPPPRPISTSSTSSGTKTKSGTIGESDGSPRLKGSAYFNDKKESVPGRAAVRMFKREYSLSYNAIARLLGISTSTVYEYLHFVPYVTVFNVTEAIYRYIRNNLRKLRAMIMALYGTWVGPKPRVGKPGRMNAFERGLDTS